MYQKKHKTFPYLGATPKKKRKNTNLKKLADWLENWSFTRLMSSFGNLALIVTLLVIWGDYVDRYESRTNQAWSVLASQVPGNSGKVEALEYLNKDIFLLKDKVPLVWTDLRGVKGGRIYLEDIELNNANLKYSKFDDAMLTRADLSLSQLQFTSFKGAFLNDAIVINAEIGNAQFTNAVLNNTKFISSVLNNTDFIGADASDADFSNATINNSNFSQAKIIGTNFSNASLVNTKFSESFIDRANFQNADLTWASFKGTSIRWVDFSGANLLKSDISQKQLEFACGDSNTKMPPKLTLKKCKRHVS